ncbi:nitroreductase/quinone reductase family protein [Jannaschia sp. R86511]|uniref:nitroreductase/quinone reductase family protein n=1 Tax=Jannaschia sp. R86511 TaxID=3093853 RepID=UPI0036D3B7C0
MPTTAGAVNRLLVRLLGSGTGRGLGRNLAVLRYTGRRSGREYRLVTGYARDGRTVTIRVGMPGRKTWWRNFREPHPLRLRLAGQSYDATARVVLDGRRVVVEAELQPPLDPPAQAVPPEGPA